VAVVKKPDVVRAELERRLHPRVTCEERVTFDTPSKEACGVS